MTQVGTPPVTGSSGAAAPFRFAAVLVAAVAVPVAALYAVPQPVFASCGLLAVLLCVVGGGAAIGGAAAAVLRSASADGGGPAARGANACFAASGLSFFTLCVVAPATALIATGAWYGFPSVDARGVLMTAVAGGALLLAAVFAVSGAVLAVSRGIRMRLAWAQADLAVQVFALGAVLATVAVLY